MVGFAPMNHILGMSRLIGRCPEWHPHYPLQAVQYFQKSSFGNSRKRKRNVSFRLALLLIGKPVLQLRRNSVVLRPGSTSLPWPLVFLRGPAPVFLHHAQTGTCIFREAHFFRYLPWRASGATGPILRHGDGYNVEMASHSS